MTAVAIEKETKAFPWWAILIEGIALVILGILFLTNPASTTVFAVQVVGIYWVIRGLFYLAGMFIDHSMWGWKLFASIVGILAGILVIQHPLYSPLVVGSVLVIILGIQGLIMGIVGLFTAFKGAGWGAGILGALSIIIGLWLLFNVRAATFALPWAIGLLAIIGGIAAIFMAFKQRKA